MSFFDSPLRFKIDEVLNALFNIKNETVNAKDDSCYMIVDSSYALPADGKTDPTHGLELTNEKRLEKYFEQRYEFHKTKAQSVTNGIYADKTLEKFFARFAAKVAEKTIGFLVWSGSGWSHLRGHAPKLNWIRYAQSKCNGYRLERGSI